MQVSVSGHQLDVGDALKQYVEERVDKGVSKYFDRAIGADVVFSKEAHLFKVDIKVNEGTGKGVAIKSDAKESEVYAAFDKAADRIEKQLRRYKRRIKNHHKHSSDISKEFGEGLSAKKYIISENENEEAVDEDNPLIIAEKPATIETLTVSEAVMRMNLANLPTLMFINKMNGNINVVYHRKDGNISWIDSGAIASSTA